MLCKLLLAFLLSCLAAYADTLVIDPNGARSVWQNATPTAAQVCPSAEILQLPAGYNLSQIQYYQASGANAVYVAPVPPTPVPSMDMYGFKTAVLADTKIPPAALVELSKFTGAFNDAANNLSANPTGLAMLWGAVKATETAQAAPLAGMCTDGTTPITTEIENTAATYLVPLVAGN